MSTDKTTTTITKARTIAQQQQKSSAESGFRLGVVSAVLRVWTGAADAGMGVVRWGSAAFDCSVERAMFVVLEAFIKCDAASMS